MTGVGVGHLGIQQVDWGILAAESQRCTSTNQFPARRRSRDVIAFSTTHCPLLTPRAGGERCGSPVVQDLGGAPEAEGRAAKVTAQSAGLSERESAGEAAAVVACAAPWTEPAPWREPAAWKVPLLSSPPSQPMRTNNNKKQFTKRTNESTKPNARTHALTHACTHTRTHARTHAHTQATRTHTHTHIRMHARTHAHAPTSGHTCAHKRAYAR